MHPAEASEETRKLGGFLVHLERGRPGSKTIVTLHGSGADETQTLPVARSIDPQAAIVAPRGRIDQSGERRWFRKLTPTSFDQRSVLAQAKAFDGFLGALGDQGMAGASEALFLGYSNGGNLIHAAMLLHPGRVRRVVLLRCMPVLTRPPPTDLNGAHVLIVAGRTDHTYAPYAEQLADLLRDRRATVTLAWSAAGHDIGDEDAAFVRAWLDGSSGRM